MEVEALTSGKQREHEVEVRAHLIAVSRPAGIAARGHDTARVYGPGPALQSADVVGLPAMQGEWN